MNNNNNINIKKSPAEKRKETLLKKKAIASKSKKLYNSKKEIKDLLQAGEAYSELKNSVNEKFKLSYNVTASFKIRTIWYKSNSPIMVDDDNANKITTLFLQKYKGKIFSLFKDPIYCDSKEYKKIVPYKEICQGQNGQSIENLEYSKIYKTNYDVKTLIKKDILKEYTINDQYKRIDVIKFNKISIVKVDGNKSKNIKKMKMKQSSPLKYPELVGNIDDEKSNNGFCVYDNFLSTYKHIDENEFIRLCSVIEPVKNKSDGISAEQIHYVCQKKDISHYAFDYNKKCFLKHISKNRNYPALVYYAVNNHMYHIKDSEIAISLIKSAVEIESKINSVFFDDDGDDNEKTKNIFDDLPIQENIPIKELLTYNESTIIIYSESHLNSQLIELMNHNIKPTINKCKKTMVTKITIPISKKIKLYLFADQNDKSQNIDYKVVKALCEKEKIKFTNQTFTQAINQLKDIKLKEKHKRENFSKEFRTNFFKKNKYCNNKECNILLKKGEREIDHIIALSHDGTNDLSNLQALCKHCHYDKTQDDIEEHVNISKTHSSFSNSVSKIMESNLNGTWAFVEKIKNGPKEFIEIDESDKYINDAKAAYFKEFKTSTDMSDDEINNLISHCDFSNFKSSTKIYNQSASLDINGCRRNLLRFNKFDYPLFTVLDQFEIYNKQTRPGKYYVESNNYMPLRGNGFYYYPTIKYCLEKNIIQHSDIKYCLLSSMVTPHDHFNDFIDYCVSNVDNHKLAINSMIGNFASSNKTEYSKSLMITEDLNEAYYYFLKNNKCFIDMKESQRGNFYHLIEQKENINCETERIIYDMIVEMEAIELHKLQTIIQSKDGIVTEYKTDSIRFDYVGDFPFTIIENINIDGFFYPDGKPMYKIEEKGELLKEHMKKAYYMRFVETFDYKKPSFNIIKDVEDNGFKPLIDQIINLNGCSIQGVAGSGKSTLINNLVKEIRSKGQDVNLLTPTNISSIIIGGQTLDKLHKKLRSTDIIKSLIKDYIIVDEVSMMKEIFYKMLTVIKMIKPETKIILCGHHLQFGPVKDRVGEKTTKFYFNSDVFNELVDGNKIILTKCRRSDDKHFNNCSNVNNINLLLEYGNKISNFNICYTNNKRIEINKILMDRQKEKNKTKKKIELFLLKNPFSKISQDVYLTIDTPIISIKNKKEIKIVNGEMFRIKDIDKSNNLIYITNNYKDIEIPINKFQQSFHVAFCITSHKSQGQTINKPYTIHDWNKMDETCKYVSLSRASEFEYVNILSD